MAAKASQVLAPIHVIWLGRHDLISVGSGAAANLDAARGLASELEIGPASGSPGI